MLKGCERGRVSVRHLQMTWRRWEKAVASGKGDPRLTVQRDARDQGEQDAKDGCA